MASIPELTGVASIYDDGKVPLWGMLFSLWVFPTCSFNCIPRVGGLMEYRLNKRVNSVELVASSSILRKVLAIEF
jgi:hypothetical protein